jgi:4-amino-4-deoxy-L-arabinose transferase-like glycosyltransferase
MRLPRLTPTAAVLYVCLVAALIRIPALLLPLVIGNDGAGYLMWARQTIAGDPIIWPPYRTPGYTCFLTAVIYLFGASSIAVVAAQQLLGLAAAGLIAFTAARLFRPRHGLIIGSIAAIDPVFLGLASHAMSEMLAAFLLLLCTVIVLLRATATRPRTLLYALALGLSLGALVLVRPAFQVTIPFFALALIACERPFPKPARRMTLAAAAFAIALSVTLAPWLHFNFNRGIRGLSTSNSMFIWIGASHNNLLSTDHPLPDHVRAAYESDVRPFHCAQGITHAYLNRFRVWTNPDTRRMMVDWAISSLASNPLGYLRAIPRSLMWQLDFFPRVPSLPGADDNEMAWMLKAPAIDHRPYGQDAANFSIDGSFVILDPFAAEPGRGPIARYLKWVARLGGTPAIRIPLFLAAALAFLIALHRRHWPLVFLMTATLAYFGAHIAFLLFNSRFSAPCWLAWYLAPAIAAASWRSSRGFLGPASRPFDLIPRSADPTRTG